MKEGRDTSDPLMSLLINHDVFPLAPNKLDVLYSVLKAYIETCKNEAIESYWDEYFEAKAKEELRDDN